VILIPVKGLSTAKQRLASVLDQPSRTELAQAMLHDVAAAIGAWPHRPACALVTSDPFALELAGQYDFEIVPDADNAGETAAIEMATRFCVNRGLAFTLVIPGDIPLIQASELEEIFLRAPEEGSLLVPAADGRGTNAAFRRPPDLFPLRFGNDSFQPHLAVARATGKPCEVLQLPGIALDVDRPEDLRELLSRPGETRSQSLLRRWSSEGLLRASDEKTSD
jgi:2-phospho-L-lactate guanylyltransferase